MSDELKENDSEKEVEEKEEDSDEDNVNDEEGDKKYGEGDGDNEKGVDESHEENERDEKDYKDKEESNIDIEEIKKNSEEFDKDYEDVIGNFEKKVEVGEIKTKDNRNKQNRQIRFFVLLMVGVIVLLVGVPFIKYNYLNKFIYANLDFQKTQLGELRFFSTEIPIANDRAQITGFYSMNFRTDPRTHEDIEIDIPGDTVLFNKDENVYITLDPEINNCEDNVIAVVTLSGFIKDFANYNVTSAFSDEDYAKELGYDYVTCENTKNETVISIKSGNETKIVRAFNQNCYVITYNNCELILATDKFMMLIIEKYIGYFSRK